MEMTYSEEVLASEYKKSAKKNINTDLLIALGIYFLFTHV